MNKSHLYYQSVHNENVYARIAAYNMALGRSIGDTMYMLMDTFEFNHEQARNIIKLFCKNF